MYLPTRFKTFKRNFHHSYLDGFFPNEPINQILFSLWNLHFLNGFVGFGKTQWDFALWDLRPRAVQSSPNVKALVNML